MVKKNCPICHKPYNDYIKHIWTHKAKTVKYLQDKRKSSHKSTSRKHGKSEGKGLISEIKRILSKYD